MITKQEVDIDGDKIRLRNTFDIAAAKEAAHEATQEGDSRKATYKCMGYIPPEMWQYDPWLIQARKAQIAGDFLMCTKLLESHTKSITLMG